MSSTRRIDSHVHLWDRGRFAYGWLDDEPATLRRDFLAADLSEHVAATSVERVVVVQADCRDDQALDEAVWMHELAHLGTPILAVVAHAPLETDCREHLTALSELPLVTGVRRLLQGERPGFATSAEFIAGVRLLEQFGFSMDLCIRQHQLAEAIELVRSCPGVNFVLDHLGKPIIRPASFSSWASAIADLASLPNVSCKLSGLMTEAAPDMRVASSLSPWLVRVLEEFGPHRCMYGSDWPVLTVAGDGVGWVDVVDSALQGASPDERASVLGDTAERVYGAS